MSLLASFLIMLFILLIAHLSSDKDFPEGLKVGAYGVFGVVGLLYIIFGIIV